MSVIKKCLKLGKKVQYVKTAITLLHRSGVYLDFLWGGRVRGEDLNLSAILMYIVSMISSI